jgi:hypothetical protein
MLAELGRVSSDATTKPEDERGAKPCELYNQERPAMPSPFLIVVAALHLSAGGGPGTILMAAEPFDNLDVCKASGEMSLKTITAEPGSYAAYACYSIAKSYGFMGVITYRTQHGLEIHEGIRPTLAECTEMTGKAMAIMVEDGAAMSWTCYDLQALH